MFKPKYVKKIIIKPRKIKKGIRCAAKWINENYAAKTPILIGILKGAMPFFGNLLPQLTIDVLTDFIVISSFKGQVKRQSKPTIITDVKTNITGKDVIIIDDVLDSARTMKVLISYLKKKKPKSIKIVVLVDKPSERKVTLKPDFAAFSINNVFIVGFGLDIKEKARNLPYIAEFNRDYLNKI